MTLSPERDVLLFYADFDRDPFTRRLRRIYHALRPGRPKVTGFEVWFRLLVKALKGSGCRVHVNATALARRNPRFPVGISGYPYILDDWALPNPAVLGPGLLDHPSARPLLMKDPRFKLFVTTCDWYHRMFAQVYGPDRCASWYAGIDLQEWPDLGVEPKDVDFLIYDKIRWRREEYERTLVRPIQEALRSRGLSWELVRYGAYDHRTYRALMRRSRAMIFLCEHETQGMAYQEAMAANLPILAWDKGVWADPQSARYSSEPIPASSVPYFGLQCGERFVDFDGFHAALERFLEYRARYAPRAFVQSELSLAGSARLYRQHLARAAG
jgi:hypothetical protein